MDGGVLPYIRRPHEGGRLALQALRGDALSPWSFAQTFSCPPKRSPLPSFTAEELHNLQILLMEQLGSGLVIGAGSKKRRVVMGPDEKLRLEQFGE